MRRPIGLWIFWILGAFINIIILVFFFSTFLFMFQRLIFFLWIPSLLVAVLFFPLLVIASIGLLKLKRWGRNIFITITLIMNLPTILLLTILLLKSKSLGLFIPDIIFIFFTVTFIIYFLKATTRKLFSKES